MSQEAQEKFNSFYNTEGVSSQLQLFTQTEFFSLIEIETYHINFCINKNSQKKFDVTFSASLSFRESLILL